MAINFEHWEEKKDDSDDLEYRLADFSAVDRVRTVVDCFGADSLTVLTSFGVQSRVMLALVAEVCPEVRVLYIDTQGPTSERDLEYGRQVLGILGLEKFKMTKADVTRQAFRDAMEDVGIVPDGPSGARKIFHALSQDVFKVTPLKRECAESHVECLLSGVRRGQTKERDSFKFLQCSQGGDPAKAHPILDWTDEQCLEFLRLKNIPPHPELSYILEEVCEASPRAGQGRGAKMRMTRSLRSSRPSDRGGGMECGIHLQSGGSISSRDPMPPLPTLVVGKIKCRFCVAAKKLLADVGIDYVEAPVHLFQHLIPAGTKTVPVIYLDKKLIGGFGDLCEYLGVEDTLNKK